MTTGRSQEGVFVLSSISISPLKPFVYPLGGENPLKPQPLRSLFPGSKYNWLWQENITNQAFKSYLKNELVSLVKLIIKYKKIIKIYKKYMLDSKIV